MSLILRNESEPRYYVYLHIKETDGTPFYVGKGKVSKRKRYKSKLNRNKWWNNIVDKHGFDIIMLEEDLIEEEAFKIEKYWIDRIGRRDKEEGSLVNLTDGGEGFSGRIITDDTRKKMSESKKGFKHSDEMKEKMRQINKGNTNRLGMKTSEETKEKQSKAKLGKKRKPHSEETKEKIRQTQLKNREIKNKNKNK